MTSTVLAPLEVFEKCDRCGAKAKVGASFLSGELYFCGHHAKFFQPHLVSKALTIYDPQRYIEKQEPLG